jgi:hypothetical protein
MNNYTCSRVTAVYIYYYQYGGLTSGRRPVLKIIAESLPQHDEKHVVTAPFSGIRVGKRMRVVIIVVTLQQAKSRAAICIYYGARTKI